MGTEVDPLEEDADLGDFSLPAALGDLGPSSTHILFMLGTNSSAGVASPKRKGNLQLWEGNISK